MEGTASELLAVLFITKLRGHREEGVASLHTAPGVPFCPGLISFPEASGSTFLVCLGRAHEVLGKMHLTPNSREEEVGCGAELGELTCLDLSDKQGA